ncbi:invasion associated locus B family protein [Puniceibacterium sediminis]|uniref:Invasion protein IalB, involved in pathogenesis n=1 Tax=Puniceibacterium sediminis TaxID=1608407 RepID=A0A238W0G6_9RHOB|nr:invasion associated locus B family protein [Puniceibacterium sediminis]SNR40006.1 Invasion protein IalB, involved in pathogenesis [Puniceibacterium sediminis]
MTRSILLLSTLAIMAAPMTWAQDTATPEAAATETATPETAAPVATADVPEAVQMPAENVLDTGEPADGATNPAQNDKTYTKTTSGAWDVQCLRVETGEEPCQMYQLLKDAQGSNVAEVSLFKVAGGGQVVAGATFVAPLETLLTQKLTIAVDTGPAKRYDFSFCTQVGCYARVGFTAAEVAAFKAGAEGKITIVPALAPDQKVTVTMSLNGFTAAYDQISSLQQ